MLWAWNVFFIFLDKLGHLKVLETILSKTTMRDFYFSRLTAFIVKTIRNISKNVSMF